VRQALPPNEVILFKLIWHPDNIADGQILPTAFRSDDLSGDPNAHVSVDRNDMAVRTTMEAIALSQASKANGENIHREKALIGRLLCSAVRAITFDGSGALAVVPKPIDGNDAHCGIVNITPQKGRAYMAEVRGKLARLASPPVTFDDAYSEAF